MFVMVGDEACRLRFEVLPARSRMPLLNRLLYYNHNSPPSFPEESNPIRRIWFIDMQNAFLPGNRSRKKNKIAE
jgi:hypothetical protein